MIVADMRLLRKRVDDLLQEHADPVFRGLVEYVVGSSELDEHSLVEEGDAVGDVAGEAHSVGDRRAWSCQCESVRAWA